MTEFVSRVGTPALPGAGSSALLSIRQVPRLLSIIIRVAVPGPA